MSFREQAQAQYDSLIARASGGERAFREEAWRKYSVLGLPDRKNEQWKYSSLQNFTREAWSSAPLGASLPLDISRYAADFDLVVLADGVLRPELSTVASGLSVLSMTDLSLDLGDGFTGLSAALARPGFELVFEDGFKAGKPLLVVHAQSTAGTWTPSLNRVRIGAGASVELAEMHVGADGRYLRSELTAVSIAAGASLNWVRVQQESASAIHFSEVQCTLAERAYLSVTQLNGGSLWSRSTLRADILGEGAEAHISGLTFARGSQHIDQRVQVRHARGNSVSTQLFKGVLKDTARGILNGKILIEKGAQKVASSQTNHNLLLSPGAEADTKPELEIYADDVKANHGASIGRLDEDKMFYLMSRGITRPVAQQMLAHAFVGDVLMKIDPRGLRAFADLCVRDWLPAFSLESAV